MKEFLAGLVWLIWVSFAWASAHFFSSRNSEAGSLADECISPRASPDIETQIATNSSNLNSSLSLNSSSSTLLATTAHTPWAQLFLAAVLILSLSVPQFLTFTQQRGSRQNNAYSAIVLNKLVPLIFMACYACLFKSYNDKTLKLNAGEQTLLALGTLLIPSFLPASARSKIGQGYPSFENLVNGLSSFLSIKIPSSCAVPAKALFIAGPLYYAYTQANKLSSPKQVEVLDAQEAHSQCLPS